ncbi:MAG: pentapeptide repeat-containing protein [Chloroflexota bacterium]
MRRPVGGTLDAILRSARVVDSHVQDGFATALPASRSAWRGVRLERMRIGSAELFDTDLVSVALRASKVDDLNARGARWTDVLLEDCVVATLDLAGATLRRIAFQRCRIGTLEVSGTTCTHVDLRTTSIGHVNGLEGLRGATIDTGQLIELAPALARNLGIVVADPEPLVRDAGSRAAVDRAG